MLNYGGNYCHSWECRLYKHVTLRRARVCSAVTGMFLLVDMAKEGVLCNAKMKHFTYLNQTFCRVVGDKRHWRAQHWGSKCWYLAGAIDVCWVAGVWLCGWSWSALIATPFLCDCLACCCVSVVVETASIGRLCPGPGMLDVCVLSWASWDKSGRVFRCQLACPVMPSCVSVISYWVLCDCVVTGLSVCQ